tara:strand:+ start:820 stop:1134 length:315 start_codon:yes stop_codon:yes gene_type:complete
MSGIVEKFDGLLNEKLVQVSIVSGILFFIVAHPEVFAFVEKLVKQVGGMVGVSINLKGTNLLIFHSLVFAILVGFAVKYVLEPIFYESNGLFQEQNGGVAELVQ